MCVKLYTNEERRTAQIILGGSYFSIDKLGKTRYYIHGSKNKKSKRDKVMRREKGSYESKTLFLILSLTYNNSSGIILIKGVIDMRVVDVKFAGLINEPCPEGFLHTGEVMRIAYDKGRKDELIRTFYVLKGKYTPQFEVRDCGDHYIKSNYSIFDYINKNTLEVIKDVSDE